MAPTKKLPTKSGKSSRSSSSGVKVMPDSTTRVTKSKTKSKSGAKGGPPPKHQKTKSTPLGPKKHRRIYTEKELGIPALNKITPVGVEKPSGKKKGKVFVDDQESMLTILAIVNANNEGHIESKIMKARQMEEIREARKKEAESRQDFKKSKLEETKGSLLRKRNRKVAGRNPYTPIVAKPPAKKQVSFA
ncbi:MAG: 60S ribosomal subunit assembly/export protein [Trizodia sp. TS-e1964]|nr:MAG: 60S ribosomal subunit assembly/export protein [Trizodia sp. TS-e1964]